MARTPLAMDPEEFAPHEGEQGIDPDAMTEGSEAEHQPMQADGMAMDANILPMVSPELMKLRRSLIMLQKLSALPNAAEAFEDDELNRLGETVVREYKLDIDSRSEWEDTARRAMDMAKQKKSPKNHPWEGASNVKYPLLTTAALQFAARAYPAIVDGPRIVKCKVTGRDPDGIKAAMADRVSQHMSYQLLYEVDNWESDIDTCLHQIPIVGCAFKKVYPDPNAVAGFGDDLVSAFDLIVNQKAKSLESVPRITHKFPLYPHEIDERKRSGMYRDVDLPGTGEDGNDDDAPHVFLEQHRYWDADGDGVKEPWIVTVHEETQKVVRIKPCFDVNKIESDVHRGKIVRIPRAKYFVLVPFLPDPEGGFYPIGFGKLLESLSDVIDTTINQMMDAGTLQNSGGGFIGGGIQLQKAQIKFKPGEYRSVPNTGPELKGNIVTLDHPGPSQVLFTLLEMMISAGKDIAAVKDVLTGETPTNQTATSTMAAIEQGLKVFTAIYKRIYRALRAEYKMIFEINKTSLDRAKYIELLDVPIEVSGADYQDDLDITPMADPNSVTDMQRMAKAQFGMEQVEKGNPFVDGFEATKRAFEAARIENVADIVKKPQPDPKAAIAEAGMKAEVEKTTAAADKDTALAEKARVDSTVALATAAIPPQVVPQIFPMPFPDMGGNPMGYAPPMLPEPPQEQAMDGGQGPEGGPQDSMQDMGGPMPPQQMPGIGAPPGVDPATMAQEGGHMPPMHQ